MKKKNISILIIASIIGIGCLGIFMANKNANGYDEVLKKAKKDGVKQKSSLKGVKIYTYPAESSYIAKRRNFSDMDDKTTATVQGVVTNWVEVSRSKNDAVTILTVYVKKGLTPKSKKLEGKTIYVYQEGGYTTRKNLPDGIVDKDNGEHLNEKILFEKENLPIPTIGTEVVVNVTKVPADSVAKEEKKSINIKQAYSLGWSDEGMWIKPDNGRTYKTAHEVASKQNGSNTRNENSKIDTEITKKINELVNK